MATTVTTSTDTYTATVLDGYRVSRSTRNLLRPILGTNEKALSFRSAALRAGSFRLQFATFDLGLALFNDLATLEAEATLADTIRTGVNMAFVPDGKLDIELDKDTLRRCWLTIPFEEVSA